MIAKQQRAVPMAAADRRRSIVDAVIPLLIDKGASVTTAEMAQAAGIAEGTIFRVFPDKPTLIYEAVKFTMDPGPVADAIAEIDPTATLAAQLEAAADVLLDYHSRMFALAELLRLMPSPPPARKARARRLIVEANAAISATLTEVFERNARELRVEPVKAIAALRGLVFSSGHPLLPPDERLTVDEIVAILLAGIARRVER